MGVKRLARNGFTLIEMLLVLTVIALLAVLIVSAMKSAAIKAKINLAQTQLSQMESAINDYKQTLGYFPPDNPTVPAINPLYFELLGTTNDGNNYVTLDASGQTTAASINATFGRQGFSNTGRQAHGSDERIAPISFLSQLKANQVGAIPGATGIKILVCSVEWPDAGSTAPISGTILNPWRYVSTHPANNPGSFDLWVDLSLGDKTYRVNNWNQHP